jgi:HlyD family secretion protein
MISREILRKQRRFRRLAKRDRVAAIVKILVAFVIVVLITDQITNAVSASERGGSPGTILPARILPGRMLSISRTVPATVSAVMATPGDTVLAGQELAILESPEVAARLERAQARWRVAQEHLNARNQPGGEETSSRIDQEHVTAAARALEAAKSRVQSNSVAFFQQECARLTARTAEIEKLVAQQLATEKELNRSRRQTQEATQNMQDAIDRQSRSAQELDAAESQLRVAQLQAGLNARSVDETVRREGDEAAAELYSAQRLASELHVRAGSSGTVISSTLMKGDRLAAGTTLFEIADSASLRVDVPASAKLAKLVRKGNPVKVRLPMDPPREIVATVSNILLVPEGGAQSYTIEISILNPNPQVILTGLEAAVVFPHMPKEGFSWPKLPF